MSGSRVASKRGRLSKKQLLKVVKQVQRTAPPASRYLQAKFSAEAGLASCADPAQPVEVVAKGEGEEATISRRSPSKLGDRKG